MNSTLENITSDKIFLISNTYCAGRYIKNEQNKSHTFTYKTMGNAILLNNNTVITSFIKKVT